MALGVCETLVFASLITLYGLGDSAWRASKFVSGISAAFVKNIIVQVVNSLAVFVYSFLERLLLIGIHETKA